MAAEIRGFWTGQRTEDPALSFRFRVSLNGEFLWYAKTVEKPKMNIPVLAKDEYYLGNDLPDTKPGEIIDFQPITMTMIDPIEPHVVDGIVDRINQTSGELFPRINGATLMESFGEVMIEQIDHEGRALETWILKGAFPTSIDFGNLSYSNSDMVEISITFEYKAFEVETIEGKRIVSQPQSSVATSMEQAVTLDGSF